MQIQEIVTVLTAFEIRRLAGLVAVAGLADLERHVWPQQVLPIVDALDSGEVSRAAGCGLPRVEPVALDPLAPGGLASPTTGKEPA